MGARLGGTHKAQKFYKSMDARAVRLWHWRKAMSARLSEKKALERGSRWAERQARIMAEFHIKCVQALNDHPNCLGSTAESDDRIMPRPKNRRQHEQE